MSEAESVLAILKEVREGLQNLSCRVESLEGKNQNLTADESSGDHGGHTYAFSPSQGAYSAQFAPTSSVEADYLRVKGSVQSVRLPSDLTLQEARQGIKRDDLPLFNVLAKNARFTETLLKICANADKAPMNAEDVFCVAYAHMKFLQEEYAALVVNSSFDPSVSKLFRSLQKNSGFSQETMEQLKNAATIASAYRPQAQANRGRGGRSRGGFRNTERGRFMFPKRGGGGGDNQAPQE